MDDAAARKFADLERQMGYLRNQLELERLKTFSMMSAMIDRLDLKIVDAKSEFASIAPIERLDGKSDCTILAFSGLILGLSMPAAEFYRMSAKYGQTVYFIKDHHQAWYQRGLLGLSRDVPSTTAVLRQTIAHESQDLRMFGTSAGGFAAILFGILLKARKIVVFAPQTLVDQKTVETFKSQDTRAADVLRGNFRDLVPILQQNESTEIHVHYAAEHPVDSLAAERLRGLPGVTLHAHPHDTHAIAAWLRKNGQLDDALSHVFDPAA